MSFLNKKIQKPLNVVVNSGNGTAGPTFDFIAAALEKNIGKKITFTRIFHEPDGSFPNGVPNPLIETSHNVMRDKILATNSAMGIAFDGDFDRCFFFDEKGQIVSSQFIIAILSEVMLERHPGSKIVHDPRIIWPIKDTVHKKGGLTIQSKTGHAFMKAKMRKENAIYGGELSAHHYFKDFCFCDSGMIPWIYMIDFLSRGKDSFSRTILKFKNIYPDSGEINFEIENGIEVIERLKSHYINISKEIDQIDGLSMCFDKWRFNVRLSNTEPLLRLNIETFKDKSLLKIKLSEIKSIIETHKKNMKAS